jgi:hypothetical protein
MLIKQTHSTRNRAAHNYENMLYRRTLRGRYAIFHYKAKQRKIKADLTFDQYVALIALPCHYCGGALPAAGVGLDRIVNAQGYVVGNVRPCCKVCNIAKNDRTEQEFVSWVSSVAARLV